MDTYHLDYEAMLTLDGKTYCFIYKKMCIFANCKRGLLLISNGLGDFYTDRLKNYPGPFNTDNWTIKLSAQLKQDKSDMFLYIFNLKKCTLKTRIKEALTILEHYIKTGKLRIS